MKLTPEQIAEIATGPVNGFSLDCADANSLLDHIADVEKQRDDWRGMAGRLANALGVKPFSANTGRDYNLIADYDAMVKREGGGV